jgi:DNA-binding transcriptional LysR family regulator
MRFVDRHFSKMKFKPDIRLELGSNEAIKESVAGGLGLGILSQHALHGREKEYGVCVLKVNGFPLPSSWHMDHHTPAKLSPAANAFREHVLNVMDMKKAPR